MFQPTSTSLLEAHISTSLQYMVVGVQPGQN